MVYHFVLAACLSFPLHAIVCLFDHNYGLTDTVVGDTT